MKVLLAVFISCGILLYTDATCTIANCGTGVTCTELATRITCYDTEIAGCNAQNDASGVLKTALNTAKSTAQATQTTQKCGAAGMTFSVVTLLFSVFAAFIKM